MKTIKKQFCMLTAAVMAALTLPCAGLTAFAADPGDLNGDGAVNKSDVRLLTSYLLNEPIDAVMDWKAGDMDDNGKLNACDLSLLKRICLSADVQEITGSIHLKGSSIEFEGKNISVTGTTAVISASGTYYIDGTLKGGQVVVNVPDETTDSETVKLYLNGVSMENTEAPCLLVENAEKTTLHLVEGAENTMTDGLEAPASKTDPTFAVIQAKDDLTIKESGSLTITAGVQYGIQCNNDLKLNGGNITVKTENDDAIRSKTSVSVKDGVISVNSEGDGIKSTKGTLEILGGTVQIKAGNDALQSDTAMSLKGGTVSACGDRGIKAGTTFLLDGCTLLATATDEPIMEPTTAAQAYSTFTSDTELLKNTAIGLEDPRGPKLTMTALKKFTYALVSSPQNSESATIWVSPASK